MLPSQPNWHLLITSREEIPGFYYMPLGFLSEQKAIELFKKHYTIQQLKEQDIKELVQGVDYHTLTIEILAKTAQVQRYDSATLKGAIKQDIKANINLAHNGEHNRIDRVGSYLSRVFSLSKLNNSEIWMLKQFACMPAEFHSYMFLYELLAVEGSIGKEILAETLSDLSQRGWLLYNTATDSYKMHLIISEVVKKQLSIAPFDVKRLIESSAEKLQMRKFDEIPVYKFSWIPFAKFIADIFRDDTSPEIAVLQTNLGWRLKDYGDYEGAKSLFHKAYVSDMKNYGESHPTTARRCSNLAIAHEGLGEYEDAKSLLEKSVFINEKCFGKDDPITADSYHALAVVLDDLKDYPQALHFSNAAIESIAKSLGTDHPKLAAKYEHLGKIYLNIGCIFGSKFCLQESQLLHEKHFGHNHPDTASCYYQLAVLHYYAFGNTSLAFWFSERALNIYKDTFPEGRSTITKALKLNQIIKKDLE